MDIRGPYSFVIAEGGWPMSNLDPRGCKHDVTVADDQAIAAGHPRPCHKCGCLLIPWPLMRDMVREYEASYALDPEYLNRQIPTEAEIAASEDYSDQAETLWEFVRKACQALDPASTNTVLRSTLSNTVRAMLREGRP